MYASIKAEPVTALETFIEFYPVNSSTILTAIFSVRLENVVTFKVSSSVRMHAYR